MKIQKITQKFLQFDLYDPIGRSNSTESQRIYNDVEGTHAKFTILISKMMLTTVFVLFLLSALMPISYAIFDYPPPQQWHVIFDYMQ